MTQITKPTIKYVKAYKKISEKFTILGFATIEYCGLLIKNVQVVRASGKPFLKFPSRKNKDGEYEELIHPITAEVSKLFKETLLQELDKADNTEFDPTKYEKENDTTVW